MINERGDLLKRPKIVVLGAGFGGLMTVTKLQKELDVNEAEIVLINKDSHYYQKTWFHQVAGSNMPLKSCPF